MFHGKWFTRTTLLGTRLVYGQKADQSCGIACVMMVNYMLKRWELARNRDRVGLEIRHAADDAFRSEADVYAAYAKVSGQPYNGSKPTFTDMLVAILNELNIGHWQQIPLSSARVADRIIDSCMGQSPVPMILHVNWQTIRGAHFVVCDAAGPIRREMCADFCDPWDAAVHTLRITRGQPISYSAAQEMPTGAPHHYDQAMTGAMDGWVICRTMMTQNVRQAENKPAILPGAQTSFVPRTPRFARLG
jgi:hypothetical protein